VSGEEPPFLLLYGSLRRGEPMFGELALEEALDFVGEVDFPGELYDLGDYPGAVAGEGRVRGELYRMMRPEILEALDRYEEYDQADPEGSLFVRRRVPIEGIGEAWVYLFNGRPTGRWRIASGDWRKRRPAA